jgi:hypothetical protein
MENYINPVLKEEVNSKLEKISSNPEYYDRRKNLVIQELRSIGDVYSFWIENPALRRDLLSERSQSKALRKLAMHGIQNVSNAWYYLNQIGKFGNFVGELNQDVIKKVNKLVLGSKGAFNQYREMDVTLNCPGYTPPSFEKVSSKVKDAISRIKMMHNDYGPLESALTAHLALAAIQPFEDGNKRTSRLIQDRILYDSLIPPAIIPAGEGTFYLDLLCRTFPPYKGGDVDGQREFYDYCASKVNNGLDEILGDLVIEPAKLH